jgi:hypothetical protein
MFMLVGIGVFFVFPLSAVLLECLFARPSEKEERKEKKKKIERNEFKKKKKNLEHTFTASVEKSLEYPQQLTIGVVLKNEFRRKARGQTRIVLE